MTRPNFFIVGAPKCGTTAVAEYLRHHPDVFLSTPKEPFYFCSDFSGLQRPTSEREYLSLFERAPRSARAVGEATTLYLSSSVAIPAVRRFAPDARIFVLLRSPVEVAHAFHSEQISALAEDEPDFETAWRLQAGRRRGSSLPRSCREPALLQYRAVASLGSQLERLLEVFPAPQVSILWFEDLKRDARGCYREVLGFLGLSDDGRREFPIVNENRRLRLGRFSRLVIRPPAAVSRWIWKAKQSLGLDEVSLLGFIRRWNAQPAPRAALAPEFRRELVEEFGDEVRRLERMTGRDLSHWR